MTTRSARAVAALTAAVLLTCLGATRASGDPAAQPSVRVEPRAAGGAVPGGFIGFSIEWSLVERYMGPAARPVFANLLRNLGGGVLRIGGSSQDVMPFDPAAANTNRVITPEDLSYVRSTLDAANAQGARSWGVVLGTAMSPPSASRPFVSPEHARTFVTQGVGPVFSGAAAHHVVGVELGNEPDLSYGANLDRYLGDLTTYAAATDPYPIVVPNTSEDILPWPDIAQRTVPTRYFWDWPRILDTATQPGGRARYASDHFYPLARTCPNRPYRCPSIGALLSDEHMASLDYQAYTHEQEAARHRLAYRLEETNTAANRGADGVSNVAASAAYALDLMFHVACPQPPDDPSANRACRTGGIGVNFHNAEVRAFFAPEEGNAYYNAIDYDPTPAMAGPTAAPVYYATLLFGRFAQGTRGLRPVAVTTASQVKAWQVAGAAGERRLFLINKGDVPMPVSVAAPGSAALVDRMTPYDPTGGGRTLDAAQVRIDGRQVGADGTWPGFRPAIEPIRGGRMTITLGAGEAAVLRLHVHK
ncbi:MAG TPA: hypothetical protein VH912_32270 [Streptosporangiaceae bacterium]